MKKFLSLVLALIMTMSLVTISAGATEYKDLTDKDEIQYAEAVAVLNRIGVITGYEDGSFRPETELTRGAAAKIIVSLMIGPDAASALPNNESPYPDVPAGHTFAGVIGFCKTSGYISGYGDGTFKPANPLTGYAFAKMLLGAIGYKANIEGFVDTGWTMNVARIGNVAGLFDRISFDGAKSVTRDEACQLALNTLKATLVDYGGTNTVISSSGEVLTVQGSKAQYVTSNNRDINANINRRVINAANNEMTLEFGEEHFKDLRLEHDKYDPAFDVYGHPSNEWSYKKVTIGTFPLPADFTFTKQMAHLEDTAASKEKALGLRGYDTWSTDHRGGNAGWNTPSTGQYNNSVFDDATQIIVNGWDARVVDGKLVTYKAENAKKETAPTISEICDLTDNGVTVEVYVCPVDADYITHVVVTRTQLMEVRRVASDYVSLDQVDSDSNGKSLKTELVGYNDHAIDDDNDGVMVDIKDNNYDAYNVLKELKAGDKVAVIPYTSDDGKTWEVGEAYVPEEVSGTLTKSTGYATSAQPKGNAVTVTVGGTEYPIAQWNKDLRGIDANLIKATRKDVTLLLDKMGNALLAKDVGNANDWMIVCDYYQAPASNGGKVVWYAHGKTIDGKEDVDVNLGTIRGEAEIFAPGELVHYEIAQSGTGEYVLTQPITRGAIDGKPYEGVYDVANYYMDGGVPARYKITSKNQLLPLKDLNIPEAAYGKENVSGVDPETGAAITPFTYQPGVYSKVKFIFVSFDSNGEVESFTVKDGAQNVDWEDLNRKNDAWQNVGTNLLPGKGAISRPAEAYVTNKGEVKAVVIKTDAGEADLSSIILTTDTTRDEEVDSEGVKWHGRKIARGSENFKGDESVLLNSFTSVGDFSRIVKETEEDGTKKIEIKGLGQYFKNRSVEPLKVYGIDPVVNSNGKVNDSVGFLVGQNSHRVTDLSNTGLTAPGAARIVGTEPADFLTKTDVMGDSVLNVKLINGLIRVDSSTQWIDLREVQDDRIDSLAELLDGDNNYNLDTVELRVLMNANKGSDGFRHAYMIAVIKAEGNKNEAVKPVITVKAAVGSEYVDPVEGTTYTFEVPAGSEVTLTAQNTASYNKLTWSWSDEYETIADKAVVKVDAPAVVGDIKTLTVKAVNTDETKTDKATNESTCTVILKAIKGEAEGDIKGVITTKNIGDINWTAVKVDNDYYVKLTLAAWPEWASKAANTTLSGVLLYSVSDTEIAGVLKDTTASPAAIAAGNKVVFTIDAKGAWNTVTITSNKALDGKTMTIVESSTANQEFLASAVKAVIVDADSNKIVLADAVTHGDIAVAGTPFAFKVNGKFNNNDIVVDSVDGGTIGGTTNAYAAVTGPHNVQSTGAVSSANGGSAKTSGVKATGDKAVTITMSTTMTSLTPMYNITEMPATAVTGDGIPANARLTVKSSKTSTEGGNIKLTASLDQNIAAPAKPVKITLDGKYEFIFPNTYTADDPIDAEALVNVTADIDLSKAVVTSVELEGVTPDVTYAEVEWSAAGTVYAAGDKIILTLSNSPADGTLAIAGNITTSGSGGLGTNAAIASGLLTITTATTACAAGEEITIAVGKLVNAEGFANTEAITIVLPAVPGTVAVGQKTQADIKP